MDWTQFIEVKPGVALGKPVFKGTRLTVEFVLERLSDGVTADDLIQNYAGLSQDHLRAALAFAAAVLRRDELVHTA